MAERGIQAAFKLTGDAMSCPDMKKLLHRTLHLLVYRYNLDNKFVTLLLGPFAEWCAANNRERNITSSIKQDAQTILKTLPAQDMVRQWALYRILVLHKVMGDKKDGPNTQYYLGILMDTHMRLLWHPTKLYLSDVYVLGLAPEQQRITDVCNDAKYPITNADIAMIWQSYVNFTSMPTPTKRRRKEPGGDENRGRKRKRVVKPLPTNEYNLFSTKENPDTITFSMTQNPTDYIKIVSKGMPRSTTVRSIRSIIRRALQTQPHNNLAVVDMMRKFVLGSYRNAKVIAPPVTRVRVYNPITLDLFNMIDTFHNRELYAIVAEYVVGMAQTNAALCHVLLMDPDWEDYKTQAQTVCDKYLRPRILYPLPDPEAYTSISAYVQDKKTMSSALTTLCQAVQSYLETRESGKKKHRGTVYSWMIDKTRAILPISLYTNYTKLPKHERVLFDQFYVSNIRISKERMRINQITSERRTLARIQLKHEAPLVPYVVSTVLCKVLKLKKRIRIGDITTAQSRCPDLTVLYNLIHGQRGSYCIYASILQKSGMLPVDLGTMTSYFRLLTPKNVQSTLKTMLNKMTSGGVSLLRLYMHALQHQSTLCVVPIRIQQPLPHYTEMMHPYLLVCMTCYTVRTQVRGGNKGRKAKDGISVDTIRFDVACTSCNAPDMRKVDMRHNRVFGLSANDMSTPQLFTLCHGCGVITVYKYVVECYDLCRKCYSDICTKRVPTQCICGVCFNTHHKAAGTFVALSDNKKLCLYAVCQKHGYVLDHIVREDHDIEFFRKLIS